MLSLTQCSRFFPRRLFADAVEMIEAMGAVSDAVLTFLPSSFVC